jgi:3-hydroxypropanoate dehydrogenase
VLKPINEAMANLVFRAARSHNAWEDHALDSSDLVALYELLKWGPTSTNSNPARFAFVRSAEAKAKLLPCLSPGNIPKVEAAPCCVIVAWDTKFPELMPQLFPGRDAKALYEGNPELIRETGERNSSLQGAYLIVAARILGLDAGPLSGFDRQAVDRAFFPDGRWRSNFLCNIGFGQQSALFPRKPRLAFDEACLDL